MIKVFSEDFRTGYEAIGPMPIIASYLRRMKIADFVNFHTGEVRSNGRRMSHGDTTFVILLFLFCRPHVVSKVED